MYDIKDLSFGSLLKYQNNSTVTTDILIQVLANFSVKCQSFDFGAITISVVTTLNSATVILKQL
jgi:hypothetical protein